jgi:hypothetical protein
MSKDNVKAAAPFMSACSIVTQPVIAIAGGGLEAGLLRRNARRYCYSDSVSCSFRRFAHDHRQEHNYRVGTE